MSEAEHDWVESWTELTYDYFNAVKSKQPMITGIKLIQPTMYKKALADFMLFGRITRYPEKYIYKWKRDVLHNISVLSVITGVCGHSSSFPFDEFNDVFFYDQETGRNTREVFDYTEASALMEEYTGYDDYITPKWSNGHWLISDFAIEPLHRLAKELLNTSDVNAILVIINKIMNIAHQRSDIAELFIKGGSDSLTEITNYG